MNDTKQEIINAIWDDPKRVFGVDFIHAVGGYMQNVAGGDYAEKGKIRIRKTRNENNITVFYNGSSRPEQTDVFTYLQEYHLHTPGFGETLHTLAEMYGVQMKLTPEQQQKLNREALAREVAPSLISALSDNPTGAAYKYLTETRRLLADGVHFGELSKESIKRAKDALKAHNIAYTDDDLKALGLTEYYAEQGYNLAIPYYCNGIVKGFVYRNTKTGVTEGNRYRYSQETGRGGYCDRLSNGEPAVIAEGQFDAVRLIQAGIQNVIAIGGNKTGDEIARLLKSRNITEITYIPDLEYYTDGKRKTKTPQDAIRAIQGITDDDGQRFVRALYIADLPTPENADLRGLKIDADSYGREHGGKALADIVRNAAAWWDFELLAFETWAAACEAESGGVNVSKAQNKFNDIYTRCATPYEREQLRQFITGNRLYEIFGITPRALDNVDEWNRGRDYNNKVKAASLDLQKAIEDGANPVKVAEIVNRLSEAQSTNTRDEWEQQLNATFAEQLEALTNRPPTLQTKWEVGNVDKLGNTTVYGNIKFYPADITVFCAPTSHGKTMILFQSALDMVTAYPNKTFLYVSKEENGEQLLERALNVYLGMRWKNDRDGGNNTNAWYIPTTTSGTDYNNGPTCFKENTRRDAIRAILEGEEQPREYDSGEFAELKKRVLNGVEQYGKDIQPRLKLIHTEGSAESIESNILYYVEQFRAQNVEIGAVFVDYMQYLSSDVKSYSRHDELKEICKVLKRCAKKTNLPIIIAAQFNREVVLQGVDVITEAHIGESADVERIAHDIFLLWQVDRTKTDKYITTKTTTKQGVTTEKEVFTPLGDRSRRIFAKDPLRPDDPPTLKKGYLYIEQLKARDGKAGGWALLPFNGENGTIDRTAWDKMAE